MINTHKLLSNILFRYKEGRYPENIETLLVSNTSLSVVDVTFCFQHDHNATTFILDPPTMTLESGESKVAYYVHVIHTYMYCLITPLDVNLVCVVMLL